MILSKPSQVDMEQIQKIEFGWLGRVLKTVVSTTTRPLISISFQGGTAAKSPMAWSQAGDKANKMLEIDYDDYDLLGHMAMDLGPFFKFNTNV